MNAGVRRRLRIKLHTRQNGRCCYCQGPTLSEAFNPPVPWMGTIEHLHQKAKGGSDAEANLRLACQGCNVARPKGMDPIRYAVLRLLLLPAWPVCSHAPPHIHKTLSALAR